MGQSFGKRSADTIRINSTILVLFMLVELTILVVLAKAYIQIRIFEIPFYLELLP